MWQDRNYENDEYVETLGHRCAPSCKGQNIRFGFCKIKEKSMANKAKARQKEKEQQIREDKLQYSLWRAKHEKGRVSEQNLTNNIIPEFSSYFIRPYRSFNPKSRNHERNVYNLVKHLFYRYNVPKFLTEEWINKGNKEFLYWSILVGQGKSLHKEKAIPYLTKKEISYFLKLKGNTARRNVWLAKANTYGLEPKRALRMCDVFVTWKINSFHCDVIRFFVRNKVDDQAFNEVLDYLVNRHREDPTYSLKGRTLQSLLVSVNEWHIELMEKKLENSEWIHIDVPVWTYKTRELFTWRCVQLTSSKELFKEGKAMRHCVSSYVDYCKKGRCAIFSMWSTEGSRLTIEISLPAKIITQVSGKCNARPSSQERSMVNRWHKFLLNSYKMVRKN